MGQIKVEKTLLLLCTEMPEDISWRLITRTIWKKPD